MEQLWYTWSSNGPKSGYQIRAASPGLREEKERTDRLLPYVGYRLPEGTYDIDPKYAPVSLSLTNTNYGRILIRKVYKGQDGAGRPGAFFSHLILLNELPAQPTMRHAINLWASNFWRESESDNDPRTLPSLSPADLVPSTASPFEYFDTSKQSALKTLFASVLLALLTHENRRRLYMLAPSQVVTAMIWGLAHSLPSTLHWWNDITFTTYTDDVSKATEFIVGTFCFPTSSSQDLPDFCYNGNVLAVNIDPETFQLRRSFLSDSSKHPLYNDFSSYAAECTVNGTTEDLSKLVQHAERYKLDSVSAFLDLYEKEIVGKLLTAEQILVVLTQKTTDEEQLKKSKNQNVLVKAIRDLPAYWEGGAREALVAFCHRAENDPEAATIRATLMQKVGSALVAQSNNAGAFTRLLQALVELAPATQNEKIWKALLYKLSPAVVRFEPVVANTLFSWDTRALLLSQWTQIIDPYEESTIHVWLAVAWSDLEQLLNYVPETWYRVVIFLRLEQIEPIPADALNSEAFFHFLRALRQLTLVPADDVSIEVWRRLLTFLPEPDRQFPWSTRKLLLSQWASTAEHLAENTISTWLNVQWSQLERLLELPIPDNWRFLALAKRIQDRAPLPAAASTVIEKYADGPFAQTLEFCVMSNAIEQVGAVISFVEQLLTQKYPMRLSLLLKILTVDESGYATSQLERVNLENGDLFDFVEKYLGNLIPYTDRQHTAQFVQRYLDDYFAELSPEDLVSYQPTKDLLHNLRQNLPPRLPDELQTCIQCWQAIAHFLELGSAAAQLHEVETFTNTLAQGELSTKTRQQLNDTLAPMLASHDFEEELRDLMLIVYLMGKTLVGTADLLQSMAVVAGAQFGTSAGKIFPYIRLVLDEAHTLTGTGKVHFVASALNHLLKEIGNSDEQTFQEIERLVEDLPKRDIAEWKEYLHASRFAQITVTKAPKIPWYFFFRPYYWKSRHALKMLRQTMQGRMTTEIAYIYDPALMRDKYLTPDEIDQVEIACEFNKAYEKQNDDAIVQLYQNIWDHYQGKLYFKPEELQYIKEAEKKQLTRAITE